MSQSLSGWDGVFHTESLLPAKGGKMKSQSLSGWDGVFHKMKDGKNVLWIVFESQSLSGWDGVFHPRSPPSHGGQR